MVALLHLALFLRLVFFSIEAGRELWANLDGRCDQEMWDGISLLSVVLTISVKCGLKSRELVQQMQS
jgi:hypothetical protein